MYTFREILAYMNAGKVFTCKVISFNKKKRSGGEVQAYRAVLLQRQDSSKLRPLTAVERKAAQEAPIVSRDPNHRIHYTRNIQLVTDDGFLTQVIRKIHIPLIIEFNGEKVTP